MQPFREFLKGKQKFYWDDQLDNLFQETKEKLVQEITDGIQNFTADKPICISTDWSKSGVGFILLQHHCSCHPSSAPICCPTGWIFIRTGP